MTTPNKKKAGRPTKAQLLRNRIKRLKNDTEDLEKELYQVEAARCLEPKEDFAVVHKRYLESERKAAEKEAVTHEQAVAYIQEQAKKCPLDRAMGAKPGFGTSRPVFTIKKGE